MIRKANANDAVAITNIMITAWKSAYKNIVSDEYLNNLNYEKIVNKFERRLSGNDADFSGTIIVYENDNEVLGYAWYDIYQEVDVETDCDSELYAIYLNPQYKFKGIGTELISYVKSKLSLDGYHNMIIWCLKDNTSSIKFYEKNSGVISHTKTKMIGEKEYEEIGLIVKI